MDIYIESWEMHNGPGELALEFTHFKFQRNGKEISEGVVSFQQVFEAMKNSRYYKAGFQINPDCYGPFFKARLSYNDYEEVESTAVVSVVETFLKNIEKENGFHFHDSNFFAEKVAFNIRYIPLDTTRFLYFKHSFSKRPSPSYTPLTDEILGFDYFFSMIGFNESRIYLISVWYD
jgi:hypothetical protein